MANIRDYQELARNVEERISDLKDQVEEIERLGDGDEYKATLNTMLFDLYDMIDDLNDAYVNLFNRVVKPNIPMT